MKRLTRWLRLWFTSESSVGRPHGDAIIGGIHPRVLPHIRATTEASR